jgi:hypothetical protein
MYSNMIGYKWKPIEHMTIDFFICKLPTNLYDNIPYKDIKLEEGDNIYILFSGISKQDFDSMSLSYMTNYKYIVPEIYHNTTNLFPIQFSTSDKPYNYIYISKDSELDEKIGEFSYNKSWNLKKIRYDRDVELSRNEYFGNYYKIAEMIWMSINNPLTLNTMVSENTDTYFINDDNQFYKSQRNYNSFVKSYLIETVIDDRLNDKNDKNIVIDLAAGKGQDMARLSNAGFQKGLFLDNNKDALTELINRKHNFRSKGRIQILTKHIDLTDNYKNIIKELDEFNIKKNSVDLIICNFAIHYIISNKESMINLMNLIKHFLVNNGRFIFTCFDGEKIFNLLSDSKNWNSYDKDQLKYSIIKKYDDDIFLNYGQSIDVLLPFSNNEYYTEYLINFKELKSVFESNGFTLEVSGSFITLLDMFKENNNSMYNNLSESDLEYISLYNFGILKKNKSETIISKSNIYKFFKDQEVIGSNDSGFLGNLKILDNIDVSNRILILVNSYTNILTLRIEKIFERKGYKNYYTHKKNKNNIFKIINCEDFNNLKHYWDDFEKFDSIIIYTSMFSYINTLDNTIVKNPIIPIILSDANDNKIYVIEKKLAKRIQTLEQLYYIINNENLSIASNYIN